MVYCLLVDIKGMQTNHSTCSFIADYQLYHLYGDLSLIQKLALRVIPLYETTINRSVRI